MVHFERLQEFSDDFVRVLFTCFDIALILYRLITFYIVKSNFTFVMFVHTGECLHDHFASAGVERTSDGPDHFFLDHMAFVLLVKHLKNAF